VRAEAALERPRADARSRRSSILRTPADVARDQEDVPTEELVGRDDVDVVRIAERVRCVVPPPVVTIPLEAAPVMDRPASNGCSASWLFTTTKFWVRNVTDSPAAERLEGAERT